MSDYSDKDFLKQVAQGDERAFERAFDHFATRLRLVIFRLSHRVDWIDDLANETWCRAFRLRTTFDPATPLLVWLAGISRNVYREFCRDSVRSLSVVIPDNKLDMASPEQLAHEAEILAALNECVADLSESEGRIVRMRFFENRSLRHIAQEIEIPEATLREKTIVSVMNKLRRCLESKKIEFSEFFSAQRDPETQ